MFARPESRANHIERQQININLEGDSEHKIAYNLCNHVIYALRIIGSKIMHHIPRPIWVLCVQKTNKI